MLLISEIAEIKKNEKNFLAKMDIEKAFDSFDHSSLISVL